MNLREDQVVVVRKGEEVREGGLRYRRNRDWAAGIYTIGWVPKKGVRSYSQKMQRKGEKKERYIPLEGIYRRKYAIK